MTRDGNGQNGKPTVLVVVQLSGGNDFMNTVIPYRDPFYYDFRKSVAVPEDEVLPIDDAYGFHPAMVPMKEIWDQGKMAIVAGVGYPNPNRSHFRSMDIWHTCEPDSVATEGWLGRAIRDMDPRKDNVLTGVNFGNGLPRALVTPGVPVTSVAQLEGYGLLTSIDAEAQRSTALDLFQKVYGQAIGTGPVMDYIRQTGLDALKGAEILKQAPARYSSSVEYADNPIAQSLRGVAQVHLADLGTRVFYTQHGGFDVHANEVASQQKLWTDVSGAISDFFADLREHDASENVIALVFTEFGRRVRDNGNGTDHGSGGGSFLIGDRVRGGMYAEYPSLAPEKHGDGDLRFSYDYRGLYSSILEQWLGLDPVPIVDGTFEQIGFFEERT
jgi:uncharacterized protein (DUF1501 family)